MKLTLDKTAPLTAYIEWNPETGEITGPLAQEVIDLLDSIVDDGGLVSDPLPSFYPVANPYRNPAELAVILHEFWDVPDQLQAAYAALVAQKVADTEDGGEGAVY